MKAQKHTQLDAAFSFIGSAARNAERRGDGLNSRSSSPEDHEASATATLMVTDLMKKTCKED